MIDHIVTVIWKNKAIIFVCLLALLIRLWHLGELPGNFYVEEMTNAYVGRFILLNGKDIWGNIWPLFFFDKFGDFAPVLPLYFSGASTFLFGITPFAARFPIAVFGALTVFPVYLLTRLLSKSHTAALFAGLFITVVPWHVVLSRTTSEGVIGMFTYVTGLYLMFLAHTNNPRKYYLTAALLFLISYLLYPSLRILIPLTILPLVFITKHQSRNSNMMLWATIAASFLLTFYISTTSWGTARFYQTSIFHNIPTQQSVNTSNQIFSNDEGRDQILLARIFHNKIIGYTREFLFQYAQYFSPVHLFLRQQGQNRYYNVPEQGILFIILAPLLLLGLLQLGTVQQKKALYVVYLLLIAPIPAALTVDFPPHVHRAIFQTLPIVIIAALGLEFVRKSGYKKIFLIVLMALTIETVYFWHQYSRHSNSVQSVLRNDGEPQVVQSIIRLQSQYSMVLMPSFERLPVYYLFYKKNFSTNIIGVFREELRADDIDNVHFVDNWCPLKDFETTQSAVLLVQRADCPEPKIGTLLETITRRDSTGAYKLYAL